MWSYSAVWITITFTIFGQFHQLIEVVATADGEETYATKYDNVDVDEILKSDRLLNNYVKCLLDEGPCTPDGQQLKITLPDAIQTDCHKCSEQQKIGANKVVHYLIDEHPDDWSRLIKIYDPDEEYTKHYLASKSEATTK